MTGAVSDPSVYTDVNGLAALKRSARAEDPAALREAARQFESLFAKMMLKSMREASFGDPVFGSDQQKFYQGMFDDQLAVDLTKGHGLGLADMLIQQLTKAGMIPADAAAAANAKTAATSGAVGASGAAAGKNVSTPGAGGIGVSAGSATTSAARAAKESMLAMLGAGFADGGTSGAGGTSGGEGGSGTGAIDFLADQAKNLESALSVARQSAASGTANTTAAVNASGIGTSTAANVSATDKTRTLTPEEFVKAMWPSAQAAGQLLGIDPNNLVAQAALETGWGRSLPKDANGNSSFNLFGVKAGPQWSGASVASKTLEFEQGVPVARTEKFRAYDSAKDSFNDYVALLRDNPRYADALNTGSDTKAFASALQRGGYATDPAYAQKLQAVAQNVAEMKVGLKSEDTRPITQTSTML